MKTNRKAAEEFIYKVMSRLDPSGKNTKRYKDFFSKMSNEEFHQYMLNIKNKKDVLVFYSSNMSDKLRMDDALALAKELGVLVCEKLRIKDPATGKYFTTPFPYPILQVPIRRFSQFADHKFSVAEGDSKIDALTGQVVKPDKAGSISQVEVQALYARGLTNTITELIKYRGGDVAAYAEYKRELEEQGRTSVEKETNSVARSAITFDMLYSGAHIESNASGV